jgi:fructose-bisphosphate aldolase class II
MSLVPMRAAIQQARPGGLLACNVIQLEHAEAIVGGAEAAGRPVVLQISQNTAAFHDGLAPLALGCLRLAGASSAPVVVHLDHATRDDLVREAVNLGVGSVMFDASALPYSGNVAVTAEITRWCHRRGTWVEAELGEIGGKDGVHAPGARTHPADAARYVSATGVDALAVAVGSSHAMLTRDATLDNELIASIAAAVDVPLVLHGSSGVPDDGLIEAVRHGMVKINIATQLNKVMTAAVRRSLESERETTDPRVWIGPGRRAITEEVARLLTMLGS